MKWGGISLNKKWLALLVWEMPGMNLNHEIDNPSFLFAHEINF
jgi:hypothetical protein